MLIKYLYFLVLFLPACTVRRRGVKKQHVRRTYIDNKKMYTLTVEGVECKQCALSVLYHLTHIKGIKQAECTCPKQDFEQASFECLIDSEKQGLPLKTIVDLIRQDEFEISTIIGQFKGDLFYKDTTLMFKPIQFDRSFTVGGNLSRMERLKKKIEGNEKKVVLLKGRLDFEGSKIALLE